MTESEGFIKGQCADHRPCFKHQKFFLRTVLKQTSHLAAESPSCKLRFRTSRL